MGSRTVASASARPTPLMPPGRLWLDATADDEPEHVGRQAGASLARPRLDTQKRAYSTSLLAGPPGRESGTRSASSTGLVEPTGPTERSPARRRHGIVGKPDTVVMGRTRGTRTPAGSPGSKSQTRNRPTSAQSQSSRSSEMILSSLIDSISEIVPASPPRAGSSQAGAQFSSAPTVGSTSRPCSRPKSRNSIIGGVGSVGENGADYSYAAYIRQLHAATGLSDAAEPPVVRTAKPPSGFSVLTAPSKPGGSRRDGVALISMPVPKAGAGQGMPSTASPSARRVFLRSSSASPVHLRQTSSVDIDESEISPRSRPVGPTPPAGGVSLSVSKPGLTTDSSRSVSMGASGTGAGSTVDSVFGVDPIPRRPVPVPNRRSSLRSSDSASGSPATQSRRTSRQLSRRGETIGPVAAPSSSVPARLAAGIARAQTAPMPEPMPTPDLDDADMDIEVTRRIRELRARKQERDQERDRERQNSVSAGFETMPGRNEAMSPSGSLVDVPINYRFVVESLEKSHHQADPGWAGWAPMPARKPPAVPASIGSSRQSSASSSSRPWPATVAGEPAGRRRTAAEVAGLNVPSAPQTRAVSFDSSSRIGSGRDVLRSVSAQVRASVSALQKPRSIDDEVDDYLAADRLSHRVRDPVTGRVVCFSDVGDPNGQVVICCVGMGLTRYITVFYDELAKTLRLRLITPDRPGVGYSDVDPDGTPLSWPDDVRTICSALSISRFSLLAHSAGAIYALATALRMPQHIRGNIHLLAPWIPPSQLSPITSSVDERTDGAGPTMQLPKSQRLLRVLPTTFLRVANSGLIAAAAAGNGATGPKQQAKMASRPGKRSLVPPQTGQSGSGVFGSRSSAESSRPIDLVSPVRGRRQSVSGHGLDDDRMSMYEVRAATSMGHVSLRDRNGSDRDDTDGGDDVDDDRPTRQMDRAEFDRLLTAEIWARSTQNAQPLIDLLVCLERHRPIGFRYEDVTKAVVVHHGSKDTRVPVENVRQVGRMMKGRWDLRVLEGEPHGLMARASVMVEVLSEIADEWEEWDRLVRGGRARAR